MNESTRRSHPLSEDAVQRLKKWMPKVV